MLDVVEKKIILLIVTFDVVGKKIMFVVVPFDVVQKKMHVCRRNIRRR